MNAQRNSCASFFPLLILSYAARWVSAVMSDKKEGASPAPPEPRVQKKDDEFDWTDALAEWAQTTFAPEPAERKRSMAPPTRSRAPSIPNIDPALLPDLTRKSAPPPRYPAAPGVESKSNIPSDEPSTRTLYRSSSSLRAGTPISRPASAPTLGSEEPPPPSSEEPTEIEEVTAAPASEPTLAHEQEQEDQEDEAPDSQATLQLDAVAAAVLARQSVEAAQAKASAFPAEAVTKSARVVDEEHTDVLRDFVPPGRGARAPLDEVDDDETERKRIPDPEAVGPSSDTKITVAPAGDEEAPAVDIPRAPPAPRPAAGTPAVPRPPPPAPPPPPARPQEAAPISSPSPGSMSNPLAASVSLHARKRAEAQGPSTLGAVLGGEPSDDELDALLDGFTADMTPEAAPEPAAAAPSPPEAAPVKPSWGDEEEPTAVRAALAAATRNLGNEAAAAAKAADAAAEDRDEREVSSQPAESVTAVRAVPEYKGELPEEVTVTRIPTLQPAASALPPVPRPPSSAPAPAAQLPPPVTPPVTPRPKFDSEDSVTGLRLATPIGGIGVDGKPAASVPAAASTPVGTLEDEDSSRSLPQSDSAIQLTSSMVELSELEKLDELEELGPADEAGIGALPPGAGPEGIAAWGADVPVAEWVVGPAREAFAQRAAWLEDEARRLDDRAARARALLVVSELRAMIGQAPAAAALAREAREASPQLALVHRQLRGLTGKADGVAFLENVDHSLRATQNPTAKMHDALLAADVLRIAGDDDGARKRYEQAARIGSQDARLVLARAGMALARGETSSIALRIPEADGLTPFARATATALRLRGLELRGATVDSTANEPVRKARAALEKGELGKAADAVLDLAQDEKLARAAQWLAAALQSAAPGGAKRAAELLRALGDRNAKRWLAARGIELSDAAMIVEAIRDPNAFPALEQLVLHLLAGSDADEVRVQTGIATSLPDAAPLVAAASGLKTPLDGYVAGTPTQRREMHLGRLLAAGAATHAVAAAVAELATDKPQEMRALVLDAAREASRFAPIAEGLSTWGGNAPIQSTLLASAFVAERGGDSESARRAFRALAKDDPGSLLAQRALAALDPEYDEASQLQARASAPSGGQSAAIASLELFARLGGTDEGMAALERAVAADTTFALPSLVLERAARRRGDLDRIVSAIRARRSLATDPMEIALDGVREALLVADTEAQHAGELLAEAHRARPDDVALRELYERLTAAPALERATWREGRAGRATGLAKSIWLLEASRYYQQAGDLDGALRCATKLSATNPPSGAEASLERVVQEEIELASGSVARLFEELMAIAKDAPDATERREAYERLAAVDMARSDPSGALLWHRSVLEETPEYLPSLRTIEHVLVGESREEELEPLATSIAKALATDSGGEGVAHATVAGWLRGRAGDYGSVHELAEIARRHNPPPIWSLRTWNAHARATGDHQADFDSAIALVGRTERPTEQATLLVRAGDAALRLGRQDEARASYERASALEPGDISIWEKIADARRQMQDFKGAAEALESVARAAQVAAHQLNAWQSAAILWMDNVNDSARARAALEQAAKIDIGSGDVFQRLSSLYIAAGAKQELAELFERRSKGATDENERLGLEVERGRLLSDIGEPKRARAALQAALDIQPDHGGALDAFADLCTKAGDHAAAEQAYVRLARLLSEPEEQRDVYHKLGTLYADHLNNQSRAELAFREVLKRSPGDLPTLQRLVGIYAKQNDAARALEVQNELLAKATTPVEKRDGMIALSRLHETVSRDLRKAEQVLEAARKELPQDVTLIRALADFYTRHRQLPAVHILLDRTAGDVRRALGAGRFHPAAFEIMTAVYELRANQDAAKLVGASLAAIEGRPSQLGGAEAKAGDPKLDDLLAPEFVSGALRALLARTGEALDVLAPVDLKSLRSAPLPTNHALVTLATGIGRGMGLSSVQVHVSPQIAMMCVPVSTMPPAVVVGESLVQSSNAMARAFLFVRALKLIQARAGALVRIPPKDAPVALGGYFRVFNPNWQPPGVPAPQVQDAMRRLQAALQKRSEPDTGMLALEAAGGVFAQPQNVGPSLLAWANRTALLAVGDPNAALDAMAWSTGLNGGAPPGDARTGWLMRTPEARDLLVFSLSDAYAEARKRCGLSQK
jgi:tetratricopeptide (TPR) repeat protein